MKSISRVLATILKGVREQHCTSYRWKFQIQKEVTYVVMNLIQQLKEFSPSTINLTIDFWMTRYFFFSRILKWGNPRLHKSYNIQYRALGMNSELQTNLQILIRMIPMVITKLSYANIWSPIHLCCIPPKYCFFMSNEILDTVYTSY